MLTIQPRQIVLGSLGSQKTLTLTNLSQKHVLFKAKTTNNEVMTAKPHIGMIAPNQKMDVSIKVFAEKKFSARILISYAALQIPSTSQNIPTDLWKDISSSAIQRQIIEVKKQEELELIEEEELDLIRGYSMIEKLEESKKQKIEDYEKLYNQQLYFNNRLSQQVEISEKVLTHKLREKYEKRIIALFPSRQGLTVGINKTELILILLLSFFLGYLVCYL